MFDSKIDDWCRLENSKDMHNCAYKKLADAGIVDVLDDEVCLDTHGDIVQTKEEAHEKNYLLKHPENLIFVDEVGVKLISRYPNAIGLPTKSGRRTAAKTQT
jgi:hypothetical protein